MRRTITSLLLATLFFGVLAATPVEAGDKFEVVILGASDLSGIGTFDIEGDAAPFLCESGTLESANTRFEWLSEDSFKIWQDKVLTCDETGQVMVLELKNTIIIGQGDLGKGSWKLKDSTGFEPAPRGKGEIVVVTSPSGEPREAYVGEVQFKD